MVHFFLCVFLLLFIMFSSSPSILSSLLFITFFLFFPQGRELYTLLLYHEVTEPCVHCTQGVQCTPCFCVSSYCEPFSLVSVLLYTLLLYHEVTVNLLRYELYSCTVYTLFLCLKLLWTFFFTKCTAVQLHPALVSWGYCEPFTVRTLQLYTLFLCHKLTFLFYQVNNCTLYSYTMLLYHEVIVNLLL